MKSAVTVLLLACAPAACGALCSCAAPTRQPPLSQEAVYEHQQALQDQRNRYFHDWLNKADEARQQFLTCVPAYASQHPSKTLTATELALAAISACQSQLEDFRHAETVAASFISDDGGYAEADRQVAKVTEFAKGIVIRQVAERQN